MWKFGKIYSTKKEVEKCADYTKIIENIDVK